MGKNLGGRADLCFRALVTPREKMRADGQEVFSGELRRGQQRPESRSAVASHAGDPAQSRASRGSPGICPESQGPWRDRRRGQDGSTCFGSVSWQTPAGREGQILPGPQVWVGNRETQVRLHANSSSTHSLHPCKVLKLLTFLKGINPSLSASSVLIVGQINYVIK